MPRFRSVQTRVIRTIRGPSSVHASAHGVVACVALTAISLLVGCSSENATPTDVPIAGTGGSSSNSRSLSDAEITDFLSIMKELPGNEFPEFQPAGIPRVQPDQEPEAAVLAWRTAYRHSSDPANLAMSWNGNADLPSVLARRGYSPEEFASLVRRISLAITAASLADRIDFTAAHEQVEKQIEEMVQAIHQHDVVPDPAMAPQERLRRREAMMHALQETTALSEFLSMLSDVPPSSHTVAQRRRDDLKSFLPENAVEMAQFERVFESRAEVVPATHWQPQ